MKKLRSALEVTRKDLQSLGKDTSFAKIADKASAPLIEEIRLVSQAYAHEYPQFRKVVEMLDTPAYRDKQLTLGKLIKLLFESGATWTELCMCYRNFKHTQADIIRSHRMPAIMNELTLDAMAKEEDCPACMGTGKMDDGKTACRKCLGKGKIMVAADKQARELVLKSSGMMGEKGPLVNLDQRTINLPSPESALAEASSVMQQPRLLKP